MCLSRPKMPQMTAVPLPAPMNAEAMRQADLEQALRRRRAGAAADVLTSPVGIPATTTMGGVAR